MVLNHISIIVSSENGINFYKKLGFEECKRIDRGYDQVIYLNNKDISLEVYIDSKHPKRVSNPEALGLRHICFTVDNIESFSKEWRTDIKQDINGKFCFIYDPDNLPLEIREKSLFSRGNL